MAARPHNERYSFTCRPAHFCFSFLGETALTCASASPQVGRVSRVVGQESRTMACRELGNVSVHVCVSLHDTGVLFISL